MFLSFQNQRPRLRGGAIAAFVSLGAVGSAYAAPVDAVSFLTLEHAITVSNGALPEGVMATSSGPDVRIDNPQSDISAPDAMVVRDTSDAVIGCSSCTPPRPFSTSAQYRVNRADPTEFAEASYDVVIGAVQNAGPSVQGSVIGQQSVQQSGLAQIRNGSSPAAAQAQSGYAVSRVLTFENISGVNQSFTIGGYFNAYLLSRYTGDNGYARTSAAVEILFSGIPGSSLSYLPVSPYTPTADEVGGASTSQGLFTAADGTPGLQFSATATATGNGGFTEANLNAAHEYQLTVALAPGETAQMEFGFTQANAVYHAPATPPAPVPLPASGLMFAGALGVLAALRRKKARLAA